MGDRYDAEDLYFYDEGGPGYFDDPDYGREQYDRERETEYNERPEQKREDVDYSEEQAVWVEPPHYRRGQPRAYLQDVDDDDMSRIRNTNVLTLPFNLFRQNIRSNHWF